MATALDDMKRDLARLEAKGSTSPYLNDLRQQIAAAERNKGKSAKQVYLMSARPFPADLRRDAALSLAERVLRRADINADAAAKSPPSKAPDASGPADRSTIIGRPLADR